MKRQLAFATALCAVAVAAGAAGFDCLRASTSVERMICSTPALSAADDQLAALYDARKAKDKSVASSQRDWLRNVRNKCTTAECLTQAYATRIQALGAKATACPINDSTLLGAWENVNTAGGEFDEVNFSAPKAGESNFVSWVRHAPYVTGKWTLKDCKLHVEGTGEGTNFDFSVESEAAGKLKLKDLADDADVLLLKKVHGP
jgi:uncharacterized protein